MTKLTFFALLVIAVFIFLFIRKWVRFYKIIRFREKLKVGDYCTFVVNGKPVTGFVSKYWPELHLINVKHQGITYKIKLNEIYP